MDHQLWQVPICVTTSADPKRTKFKLLMTERELTFTLEGVGKEEWIKVILTFFVLVVVVL